MEDELVFFEPCKDTWREGFFIPVRCSFNNNLEKDFLPVELKQAFLNEWGQNIIYDDQFVEWYANQRKKDVQQRKSMADDDFDQNF